ncbi:MAG: hypothetical protein ACLQF1_06090 [Methyloceanibacter sp.]|jgi:hypothetical protein
MVRAAVSTLDKIWQADIDLVGVPSAAAGIGSTGTECFAQLGDYFHATTDA